MPVFVIQLQHLRFHGYHGLYEEEAVLGTAFEVNLSIKVKARKRAKVSIHDTVNYATVYELVKQIFSQREDLLETICVAISTAIKKEFPQTKKLSVQITKLHPPITGITGSVSVTYQQRYK